MTDEPKDKGPELFVLNAESTYQPLLEGRPLTRGMRAGRQALAPGSMCGEHSTGAHEETLVILSGRGVVRFAGGAEFEIAAGRVVYVPPETRHNVFAGADSELRYVYVVAPVSD
jgi:mannose-6-phosphate isomerase-like protein (cupin superfamily)